MYKSIKMRKKILSILLAIGIFVNMQYPSISVFAEEQGGTESGTITTEHQSGEDTGATTSEHQSGEDTGATTTEHIGMFRSPGPGGSSATFSNFEANIVLQKVLANAGELNEKTLDLVDKETFNKARITIDTPLNIKIDTKIKETIRKDDVIDIKLPDYPVDLQQYESNEYTDSGFTYRIQTDAEGKKHLILTCIKDIVLTTPEPAEYILKLPTNIKIPDPTKTKVDIPFNGEIITVNIAPKGITSSIQKSGLQQVNSIRWFIDTNLYSETIQDFKIIEKIPSQVIFDNDTAVVVKKLDVDLHGNKTATNEIIDNVTTTISGNIATITINEQVDYPVRIEFTTPVKESILANGNIITAIKNIAEFLGTTSVADIEFKPAELMEKTHDIVEFNDDKISWKLRLNSAKTVLADRKIKITELMSSKKKENNNINSNEYTIGLPEKVTIKNIDKNTSMEVVPAGTGNVFEYEFEINDDEKSDTFEIAYVTPVTNKISTHQTKSLIENIATTTLGGKTHSVTDTAEISKSMHIKKSVNGISKTPEGYKSTWKISVNFDKHNIAPVVTDSIDLTAADKIKVIKDSIKVYEVTPKRIGDENHPDFTLWDAKYADETLVNPDEYTVSEITDETRNFSISFNEQSKKAYVIKYDTLLDSPKDVGNTATLDGLSAATGLGGSTHNRIYKYVKTHSEKKDNAYVDVYDDLDMGNKTMVYYIYVEPNRAPMENIVIDDTFVNKGLAVEKEDITFSGESIADADFSFEKKADPTEGFKLSINKEISNRLGIKIVAKFSRNDNIDPKKTNFPNKITATWKDKYNETNTNTNEVEYVIPKELFDEAYKNNSNLSGTLHGGIIKGRLIDWTTNINYAGEKLPAGTTVKVYPMKQDAPDTSTETDTTYHKILDNFVVYPYTLDKLGNIKYDTENPLTEGVDYTKTDNGDGSYTITFSNPITKGYSIRYSTQMETKYTDDEKTDPDYDIENKIKFKLKNEINVPSADSVIITSILDTKVRKVFNKKGSQNPFNPYKIQYTAIFNQIAEKVPAGTAIYDVLSEEHVFIPDSLTMKYVNGPKLAESDYNVDYSVDSKARHVMKIEFTREISEPIEIKYTTHINNVNVTELKNAIGYKEVPTDEDVKNGSKINAKRRSQATLIVPKGASIVNISYTNDSCCKGDVCPIFPKELEFEIITKDSETSPESVYKTVKVGLNTQVPINISADKFVKIRLKQDPSADPKLREFESNFEKTVADKVTEVKYDVSLNEYKLKIKFEGDVGDRFNEPLAPEMALFYNKDNAGYNEKTTAATLKNSIKSPTSPNEYSVDIETITEAMVKDATEDKIKLEIPVGDVNLKNYKVELLSVNGKATTDKNVNNNEIVLNKCMINTLVVKYSRLKKHNITLRQWQSAGVAENFTDNTVANNKEIALKAKVELKKDTGSSNEALFEDIAEDIYDIIPPAISYYITPAVSTDFVSTENASSPNKVDVSKSSYMTNPTATNTDLLYKKAKKLIINKNEVIRKYGGNDETKLFDRDVTFTLTDNNDSNITAKFTVNSFKQKYKVVEDNSNIIDVQGDILYVKEGQYTLKEENLQSNYYYGYIDLTDTQHILPGTVDNKSIDDLDLSAAVTGTDVTKVIYNHRDYNSLEITKTGDSIHSIAGTKIALYTASNGKEGSLIEEKTVGSSGIVRFDNISDLEYGYKETKAADGYVLDSKFYPIKRDKDTSGQELGRVIVKTLANTRMKSKIVISKKDVSRNKFLNEVSFILLGTNEDSQDVSDVKLTKKTAKVGDISQVSWENLEVGTYKLYEKIPENYRIPAAYVSSDKVDEHIFTGYKIKVTDNKKIYTVDNDNRNTGKTITDAKNATVISNESLTVNFDVKKKTADDYVADKNNLPLSGVKYTLSEKANSNIVGAFSKTVSTDQNGMAKFENIPVGEYELREAATVDPYKKDSTITQVKVQNDNGTVKLIVGTEEDADKIIEKTNSVDYGTLKIVKTAGNRRVNNVKFSIKYIADINKVPASFTNAKTKPSISPNSNTNFMGREFTLVTSTVGGQDGVINKKLPKGIYEIKELEAPVGYKISAPHYVKVEGNDRTTTQEIKNEVDKVTLTIIKKDAVDSRVIKGAKFEIERKNDIDNSYEKLKNSDNTTVFTTNDAGKIELSVQKGDIRITELTAAPHYDIDSLKLYDTSVEDSKKITSEISLTANKTIIATNTKIKSKFVLNKKKVTRDNESINFANVKFNLYEADENYNKLDNTADYTFTTDADGKIEKTIDTGYYVIEEIRQEGYTDSIVVKENSTSIASNKLSFKKDITADTNISVENRPIYVKFKITKVKEGTTDPVKGAKVAIFDKSNTKIAEAVSGTDGVMNFNATYSFDDAHPNGVKQYDGILWQEGLYYKELTRPDGYFLKDDKHPIILGDDVSLNDSVIEKILGNKQVLGEIKVITYSRNKITNAEAKLGNVEVELEKFDGANWQKVRTANTDNNGEFVFTTLEEGKYRVVEKYASNTEVLKGFEQVDKTATTEKGGTVTDVVVKPVSDDGKDTKGATKHKLYIPHEAFFGSLTINKKDKDGNPVRGVEFGLYNDSDAKIATLITNDNGTVKKENIIFGDYYIKETKTPNNILLDTSKIDFSIAYGSRDVVKEIENDKFAAKIEVSVIDSETNEPIEDTEISVDAIGKKTTDATGKVSYSDVLKGKYNISISEVNPNYLTDDTVKSVELKDANNGETVKILYKLTKIRTGIIINKTDEKTGEKLQGIEFELKGKKSGNTTAVVKTTDEQGRIIFDNLIYDKYSIKETKTKDEYRLLDEAIEVELKQKNLIVNIGNTKKTGLLEFIKLDKDNKRPLRGAYIGIYKESNRIATFVTNGMGNVDTVSTNDKNIYIQKDPITNKNQMVMPIGEYIIKEIQAPSGYELYKESIDFEIELDTVTPVKLENTPSPVTGRGSITENKQDKTNPIAEKPEKPEKPENQEKPENSENPQKPENQEKPVKPVPNIPNITIPVIPISAQNINSTEKPKIENIKKAVETKQVYKIVDKQNRHIGNAMLVMKDDALTLEFLPDLEVPSSGLIKFNEDNNSIEIIENGIPISYIKVDDKILPRTGAESSRILTASGLAVFGAVLIITAILLRIRNRKRLKI